jgi:xanthine dehydrogenase accessory factor
MMQDIFLRVSDLRKEGKSFALATLVYSDGSTPRNAGARMLIFPDKSIEGTIGGGALEQRVISDALNLLKEGRLERFKYDLGMDEKDIPLGMLCGGKVEVLIETFQNETKIFIFGAGHVGRKLAELCGALNYFYWIIDNRETFAREELFRDAAGVVFSEFSESFASLPIDEKSYLIIVTYGHKYDGACLEAALKTEACYIGMIGSKKKVRTLLDALSKKGVNSKDPRIYTPIGLDLGDNTPEEISVSIISEIIKIKSGGSGRHCRELLQG